MYGIVYADADKAYEVREQMKKDLQEAAHITHYQMMKLARDENITTEVIGGICKALACTPDEIMEFYDE